MSGKIIVGLMVCVVLIMLVIMLTGYKGSEKGPELKKTGYDSKTEKVEGTFNATGMDTRLNQTVVHDLDVVKGDVTGVDEGGFSPSRVPSFEVKKKTGMVEPE